MSEDAGALTPTERGRLLAAAVQGVAWALIEYETDTSDRGVTEDNYRDAVRRAEAILPALVTTSTERSWSDMDAATAEADAARVLRSSER